MNGDIITIFDVARDYKTYRIRITFFLLSGSNDYFCCVNEQSRENDETAWVGARQWKASRKVEQDARAPKHCKFTSENCMQFEIMGKVFSSWCLTSSTKPVNTHLFKHTENCAMQTKRAYNTSKRELTLWYFLVVFILFSVKQPKTELLCYAQFYGNAVGSFFTSLSHSFCLSGVGLNIAFAMP